MTHFEEGYISFMKLAGLAADATAAAEKATRGGIRVPHIAGAMLGTGALAKGYQELNAPEEPPESMLPPAYWAMNPESQQLLEAFNAEY